MGSSIPATCESLRVTTPRSSAIVLGSQFAKFSIMFFGAVALARLLNPQDYGVFALALAITGFLEVARDGGMIVPVTQAVCLTSGQMDTLFWFNTAVGVALTAMVLAIAPLVAWAYSDARLVAVVGLLATMFLSAGISTQHRALLRRQMRFGTVAVCEIAALTTATVAGVTAALHGAGYWALVCLYLSNEFIQAILVVLAASWWPRLPKRGTGVRPLIRFGGLMMAFDLLGYLNYKFDNLVVGWFLGPAALGYYDRAYQFLLFPVNQVSAPLFGVAHASLSRLQSEPEQYRRHLNHCLLLSAGFGMPLVGCLYANLESIIGQLLGPQWLPAAPVFRALAPAAFLMTVTASVGWIFLSLGKAERQIRWAGFTTVLTVMAFFMGLPWGTAGVALAFSISRIVLLVPTLIYTCKDSPMEWTRILLVTVRPASASLVSLGVSTAIEALYPASGMWPLVRGVSVFGATYCLSWMVMPGGRAILRENLTLTGGSYFTASN